MVTTVLLTGFEPFGGAVVNPSWLAAEAVAAAWGTAPSSPPTGDRVIAQLLPVEFDRAAVVLGEAIAAVHPDVVIALGLAEGRSAITPERIAVNIADARIPDNAGAQPRDVRLVASGPDGRFSRLPLRALVRALAAEGIPAAVSESAGTYVCNATFYALMGIASDAGISAGFVHVPAIPECGYGDTVPTMPLETIVEAVRVIVATAVADVTSRLSATPLADAGSRRTVES